MSAFWCQDDQEDEILSVRLRAVALSGGVGRVGGVSTGSSVSFTEEAAQSPGLRQELRNFSLTEAADYWPPIRP